MTKKKLKNSHITYHDLEQGSELWNEGRLYKFTGSNADKMLTSFGAGSWAMAKPSNFSGNFFTKRGHLLETEALELYEQIENCKVGQTGFVTNDKYEDCLYSPDAFRPDRTIEVKCFDVKEHLKMIKAPSLKILAQCHFGQLILEKRLTDLILYCPKPEVPVELKLVIIKIKYDKDINNNFKEKIRLYHESR